MTDLDALRCWGCAVMGLDADRTDMHAVSGDASFRRYFRLTGSGVNAVLCDAPPSTEKNAEFVAIAGAFAAAGVRVPVVLSADLERGWLCLEDLGNDVLLPHLDEASAQAYYASALEMLRELAAMNPGMLGLPRYDRATLLREMNLFADWFCPKLLGLVLSPEARRCFDELAEALCERALGQAQVVVHRDFHARNFMILGDGELATIDFQDALIGPITYDPVSLLRDCYLRWPDERVRSWALSHRDALLERGMLVPRDDREFLQDFDFMGLQRHIKVLGIFARLSIRDGKDVYLGDLPRVMQYTRDVLSDYPDVPALADFLGWFDAEIQPRAITQPWYRKA